MCVSLSPMCGTGGAWASPSRLSAVVAVYALQVLTASRRFRALRATPLRGTRTVGAGLHRVALRPDEGRGATLCLFRRFLNYKP